MSPSTRSLLFALALGTTACGSSLVPPRQGLAMRDVAFPVRELRFPSGLRVLAERDDRTPLVSIVLVVGAGSTSDPLGKEGLAHYIEHLAFRSRPYGTWSFRHMLERANASAWNAFTGFDATVYHEIAPAASLPDLLRLEGARMLAPVSKIAPETLAVELAVVRSELRQRNETGFVGEVLGAVQAAVFPSGHPYARPVIGTHDSLSAINVTDVVDFLHRNYRPDNMTLALTGAVDLATVEQIVRQTLPAELLAASTPAAPLRPSLPTPAPEPPDPDPLGEAFLRRDGAVATPELWVGWSLPRAFDTDAYLADFVQRSAIEELAGAEREDEDIAFLSTMLVPGKDASMLLCRIALLRGAHPEKSLAHVLNRIYRIGGLADSAESVLVKERQLAFRKRSAVIGMMLEAEDLGERGIARATLTHFSHDPMIYSRALRDVVALQSSRIVDYASKYLTRARARAVLFTPAKGAGALPDSVSISSPALDEDDTRPIRVDAERLGAIAPAPGASAYQELELPNGVAAILGARPGLPLVTVELSLRGGLGAAADPAAARAAFMTAFPREKWHGDPGDFGAQLARNLGAGSMTYTLQGASGNVGIMLGVLAERLRSMTIDSGGWESFHREFVPFLRLSEQKPEVLAERAFTASLFAGHAYGRPVTGKDIEDTSLSAARASLDASYTPASATIAVVGEIDPVVVAQIVREQFEGWRGGELTPPPDALEAPAGAPRRPQILVTHRPEATQAQIHFGCLLPASKTRDVDVRHDVDARLAQDRMGKVLREQLGVTYGIHARAIVLRGGTSYLEIEGAVENARLGVALSMLQSTLEGLGAATVSDSELAWAKLRVAQSRGDDYVSNRGIADAVLAAKNLDFGVRSVDDYARSLASVSAPAAQEDLRRCAAGRSTLSIVGDEATANAAVAAAWK